MHPDAANAAKRDATPLRLLSWLSFRLEPAVEQLIEDTMLYLSTAEKVTMADLLSLGTKHLDKECESVEALRDHLIELVSVRNLRHRPDSGNFCRLTLPQPCHFLDLVLPQLTPVRAPWADATGTLWTCHHIRAVSHENGYPYKPKLQLHTSTRLMTTSITCESCGVPYRSSCFLIPHGVSCGCISVPRPSCA